MKGTLVLKFLSDLAQNNNREWFHANRDYYISAKTEVENFIYSLEDALITLDPDLKGFTEPKTSMFRLFRDIRFGADKTPYKEHIGIFFAKGGRKVHYPGYYIHIQPEHSISGGGVWIPEPTQLKAIRQEIIYNTNSFLQILSDSNFKKYYSGIDCDYMLSRIPAGYPKDFPYPELLRTKSFTFFTMIKDEEFSSDQLRTKIIDSFTSLKPMITFFKTAMEG